MSGDATLPAESWLERVTVWLAVIAAAAMLFLVILISVGVILRYAFNIPVLGLNEINQLAALTLVMAALPYCTAQSGHVGVDVFDNAIGRVGRFIGDIGSRLLSGFVLSTLAQRAILKALDAHEFEDTTNMLNLPTWPFYGILAIGIALCVIVMASQCLTIVRTGGR
ncbi:TRAP transporter small permease [Rhizobium sp. RM]|uniref:TRAP transporter small permease n=1 Tax=Rhizobium sp. RM TaxID=2748079 RepID=UPI00110EE071|nr:TRAP transporter small permease [Rhizobium sp. RM]NWJ25307.1 TRAP transporter small permease [Rhizobium sp. RM]TMV17604.1 TRAP transporter small permease [Rhizobium sp. Td3]